MTDQTSRGAEPGSSVLDRWVDALEAELGLPAGTVDVGAVLDLARDAAHQIARPAAPVTTYAAGYAAGLAAAGGSGGTGADDAGDVIGRAGTFALGWQDAGPGATSSAGRSTEETR